MSFFKVPRIESEAYLAWVRTLPCANCESQYRSDAHHRIGHGRVSTMRTDDLEAMPLCATCHGLLHNMGWKEWEPMNTSQHEMIVDTLIQAIRQGVLVIDEKVAKRIARYV